MHQEKTNKNKLHQDWRTWVVVGLMLMAIGMYVLTLDDSTVPFSPTGNPGQTSTTSSKP